MDKNTASSSATENDEGSVFLKDFKTFAMQQRLHDEKARHAKTKTDIQFKLLELKKFADSFKLSTPIPRDLDFIIAALDKQEQRRETEEQRQARSTPGEMATEMKEVGELSVRMDLVPIAGSALDPHDEVSFFHTDNPDSSPSLPTPAQLVKPKSPLFTRISVTELHHGKMVHNEEECEATLLVLDCRFYGGTEKRRYKNATVLVEFFDKDGILMYDPVVVKLAPDARHTLDKTTYDQHTRLGLSTGITAPAAAINANARAEWERERIKECSFGVVVTGTPYHNKGRNGDENAARWTMQENQSAKKGIPSLLQTAVLVKRPSGSRPFEMRLHVDSTVKLVSRRNRLVRVASDKDPRIDSVLITPRTEQMASRGVVWISANDRSNMEDIDLGRWFRVLKSNEDDLTPGVATRPSSWVAGEGATDTETTSAVLVSTEAAAMTTATTTATTGVRKEGTSGHAQVAAAMDESIVVTSGVKEEEQLATPVAPPVYRDVPPLARLDPGPGPQQKPKPSPEAPAPEHVAIPAMITDAASTSANIPASLLIDIITFSGKTADMAAHAAQTAAEAAKAAAQAAEAAAKLSQSIIQAVEKLSSAREREIQSG